MKLSTSHGMNYSLPETGRILTADESLGGIKEAGFDTVDINLWALCSPGGPLAVDSWQETVEAFMAACEKYALPVHQTHGNTMGGTEWDDPKYPHRELQHITNLRCVEATKMLNGKVMVLHPFNLAHAPMYSVKDNREACMAYLAPYIEAAKRAGIQIAVENMVDFGRRHRRYCGGDIYELIDLVDTINDPDVGICIDTGHANLSGADPAAAIRAVGDRLIALHVNDNRIKAGQDAHLLPYFGDINWPDVMKALTEVKYRGQFTYETGPRKGPAAMRAAFLKYAEQLGRHLISLL